MTRQSARHVLLAMALLVTARAVPAYGQTTSCTSDSECPQGLWCDVYGTGSGVCKQCDRNDPSWHPCPSGYVCDSSNQCVERECSAHCDCQQGSFCYYGKCLTDPQTPVYCCTDSSGQPKAGCQPGRWCFEPDGGKGTCAETTSYECQSACDCGPAHCCKYDSVVGHKVCVKDVKDPWNPGGGVIDGLYCEQGVDATYCCEEPLCHAGMFAYGFSEAFRCESRIDGSVHGSCSGTSCGSACDCDPGQSCIDTKGQPRPPFGKVCDTSFSLNPAEPSAVCVSNAVAEAVYGASPAELLPCCGQGCFAGQKCEVGWVQGGGYLLERVVGVCGGACGNGTWDPGESAISCPSDCLQPPRFPDCGAMSNAYSFYFAMCGDGICDPNGYTPETCLTCPQDCGTGADDTTPPDLTCPDTQLLECTGPDGAIAEFTAPARDACFGKLDATCSPAPGSRFPLGTTEISCESTDGAGNKSSCATSITVVDTTPPGSIDCHAPPTITPPQAPVTFKATSADACGPTTTSITGFDCYWTNPAGNLKQKTESCVVSFAGDSITILESGGVSDTISWTVQATDALGNSAVRECSVAVVRPRKE